MTNEEARETGRKIGRTWLGRLFRPVVALVLVAFYSFGLFGMILFVALILRPAVKVKKT